MATVKSLEERIDDIADEMSAVESGVASVSAHLATVNAQLAVVVSRLDAQAVQLDGIASRLDMLAPEVSKLKTHSDLYFAAQRWAAVFVLGLAVTIVYGAISFSKAAGGLEMTVQQQQKTIDQVITTQQQQQRTLDTILAELRTKSK